MLRECIGSKLNYNNIKVRLKVLEILLNIIDYIFYIIYAEIDFYA